MAYQTTSAIEQFRPEPMPSSATRLPFFRRPISSSLDSTIGTEAGPMLPCSLKMRQHLRGIDAEGLDEGRGVHLADLVDDELVQLVGHPAQRLARGLKVFCASFRPSISSIRVSVTMRSRLPRHSVFHSVAARVTPPL